MFYLTSIFFSPVIRKWKEKSEVLRNRLQKLSNTEQLSSTAWKPMLVKAVMEQMFSDLREKLIEKREMCNRIKKVLLNSTADMDDVVSAIVENKMDSPLALSNLKHGNKYYRPHILMVGGEAFPLQLLITVQIPRVISKSSAKLFSKPHMEYEIYSYITPFISQIKSKPKVFISEHRYRDFCILYENLRKSYPLSTIPELPLKRALSEKLRDAWVLEPRRRQLMLWLQYIVSHGALQISPHVLTFVSGSPILPPIEFGDLDLQSLQMKISSKQLDILSKINDKSKVVEDDDAVEKVGTGFQNSFSRSQYETSKKELVTISRFAIFESKTLFSDLLLKTVFSSTET